jgi:ankyrin repeat protein
VLTPRGHLMGPERLASRSDMVRFLILIGASVDTQCRIGRTVLHIAAQQKDSAMVELLLSAEEPLLGRLVNTQCRIGLTALHIAVQNGDERMVKRLLAAGAQQLASRREKTPLDFARELGHVAIVSLLQAESIECDQDTHKQRRLA